MFGEVEMIRRILVLIIVCSSLFPLKTTLADTARGILVPNEGWITTCMQEITHGLLDPCSQYPVPVYFLEAQSLDPSYLGQYVEITGDNVGLTCYIIQVETIEVLGDPENDTEGDGVKDLCDNCPSKPNGPDLGTCIDSTTGMVYSSQHCSVDSDCSEGKFCEKTQADTYPPQGNGIGDVCDCEANFDCNCGVDALDVGLFLVDMGRSQYFNPCTNDTPCNGDFACDGAVDAMDVLKFLEDFGR